MHINQQLTKESNPIGSTAGFSLVEALLAVSLFALFALAFAGAYFYGQESSALAGERARAALLAEEGLEAVRSIHAADFGNLNDGTYGLDITSGQWELSSAEDTQGIFTREIEISTVTENRKQVESVVRWEQNAQRDGEIVLSTYLTNWQEIKAAPPDCTGPPDQRPAECVDDGGGGPPEDDGGGGPPGNGGGPPPGAGPPGGF